MGSCVHVGVTAHVHVILFYFFFFYFARSLLTAHFAVGSFASLAEGNSLTPGTLLHAEFTVYTPQRRTL